MSDEQGPEERPRRSGFRLGRGWSDLQLRGKGSVLVAIPLLVFAIAAGLFVLTVRSDSRARYSVSKSEQVQSQIAVVDALVIGRESDERGYLAFGNPDDLGAVESDETQLNSAVAHLVTLVNGQRSQQQNMAAVQAALGNEPPLPQGAGAGSQLQGPQWLRAERVATTNVRAALARMRDTGAQLLQHRRNTAAQWRTGATWGMAGLLLIGVLGGIFGVRLFTRSIAHRPNRRQTD